MDILYPWLHIVHLVTTYNVFIIWLYIHLCNHQLFQPHKACEISCCISLSTSKVKQESLHVWLNVVVEMFLIFTNYSCLVLLLLLMMMMMIISFRSQVYHPPLFHCIDIFFSEGWHRTMSCAASAK